MRDYVTKTYDLEIDFLKVNDGFNVTENIIYNQSDTNTAFINAKLFSNGKIIDLTNYDRALLGIQKSDGQEVYNECTIINSKEGIIEIPFTTQSLKSVGVNYFDITLYKGDSKLVSPKFLYRVNQSMITDESIESSNEYGTLVIMISQVSDIISANNEIASRVESLEINVKQNEVIRESNESARKSQELIRINDENTRKSNEDTRQQTLQNMNTLKVQVETLKSQTEQVKSDTLTVKNDTLSVKTATDTVRADTLIVKNDTLNVKAATETVKTNTESVRVATNTVKTQAEEKIIDCESRMSTIETEFDNLVNGTGFATKTYVDTELGKKAPTSHTHTKSQITDFPTSLPANGGNADTVDNKHASDFANAIHTHTKDNITDFAHTHPMSDITGLSLTASNVTISDSTDVFTATNVEDALLENKSSILNKVDIVVTNDKNIPRKSKTFYFIVTDEQYTGNNIKVSPNMGLKVGRG